MTAYYNEIDGYAAQWLRNLIDAGHIAPGEVDDRSISDVKPSELAGYTQCHFFAGIGGWSLALRLAGWPDHRRVWTGSCPCQPFSVAGQGAGTADERHLWPHWFHLIRALRPETVFGEQVEAAINHGWLDLVQDDLEGEGYAFAPVGIPAAGVGAPHIRQRLWFVADASGKRRQQVTGSPSGYEAAHGGPGWVELQSNRDYIVASDGENHAVELAHHHHPGPQGREPVRQRTVECAVGQGRVDGRTVVDTSGEQVGVPGRAWESGGTTPSWLMGNTELHGLAADQVRREISPSKVGSGVLEHPGSGSQWDACDWLPCRDGKWRPVEPGTFPLAHGVSNRVGRLRAYGNAIVPQVAAQVIQAYMECRPC